MEAKCYSETPVLTTAIQRHIHQDRIIHTNRPIFFAQSYEWILTILYFMIMVWLNYPCNRSWGPKAVTQLGCHIIYTIGPQMELRLWALSDWCSPLTPGRFLVVISLIDWVGPRAVLRLSGLGTLRKNWLMGNRNCGLSVYGTVPQWSTLQHCFTAVVLMVVQVGWLMSKCPESRLSL
jgi:hypothetical protein